MGSSNRPMMLNRIWYRNILWPRPVDSCSGGLAEPKKKMLGEEWKQEENTASQMQLSGANSYKSGNRWEDKISTKKWCPWLDRQ